ncbi:MAG: response regulator [Nitrospiraceae bacterium]|nr:response regulator [Nitrospiraceae bacterium]
MNAETSGEDSSGISLLLVEDDQGDALLIREMLSKVDEQIHIHHCERLSEALEMVSGGGYDIALLDLALPDSYGLGTVRKMYSQNMDLPLIVLTGLSDEKTGIEAVKEGAQDYLVKDQINGRLLAKSILYAIERKRIENEKQRLIGELRDAMARVKVLSGLLPICSSCKKIRDDRGYWNQIESFVREHSEAEFSHGICPDCARKLYPELYGN